MKLTKKKVLVLSAAVCVLAILSMSTLAWFNASDSAINNFKFDDSDHDGTPDFVINVFETDNGQEVQGKEYVNAAIPGAVLDKDPTVRNEGDYNMYARLIVTISDADDWYEIAQKYYKTNPPESWFWHEILEEKLLVNKSANWIRYDAVKSENDTLTYVYYYNDVLSAGEASDALFSGIQIPTVLTQEDMDFGATDDVHFTVTVKGDAIQADHLDLSGQTGTEVDAYKAFKTVGWEAGAAYPSAAVNP
ncbi:MAG: SipW-dependent-type signal peptide-containing protein [Clostridia bacterium]|nr:SipW-dependent-type signal peptide-containing protein [Clostridia bacterium]